MTTFVYLPSAFWTFHSVSSCHDYTNGRPSESFENSTSLQTLSLKSPSIRPQQVYPSSVVFFGPCGIKETKREVTGVKLLKGRV